MLISIHALRVEGDELTLKNEINFAISIHALRVEGDVSASGLLPFSQNFYPRPPGGGRLHTAPRLFPVSGISIHALRVEGDNGNYVPIAVKTISIHALRVEGDFTKMA